MAANDSGGPFVHLRLFSNYSPLEGALRIPQIVESCKSDGMPAAGLTDSGNLFGALDFSTQLSKAGIQPIIGCTVGLLRTTGSSFGNQTLAPPVALLAQTERGFRNLLQLVSGMYLGHEHRVPSIEPDRLESLAEGLICLTGGAHGAVGSLIREGRADAAHAVVQRLASAFPDRLYIEIQRHGSGGSARTRAEEHTEAAFLDIAYDLGLPLVATTEAYFPDADFCEAHRILRGIAGNSGQEPYEARYTSENRLRSTTEMRALFSDLPEAFANASDIARRISYRPAEQQPILPSFAEDETELLRRKAKEGLEQRLETIETAAEPDAYWKRLEYELDVIITMNYAGYFLIVSEFVNWAHQESIPVGPGRGSGAGSLVAYALRIVDLDPIRYGLLFERFLNPERVSMPDFDIDFCEVRRDEVMEHVRKLYGTERVAKIVTFNTLQARAALHDTGRVLGMARAQTDRIANAIPYNPARPTTLREAQDKLQEFRQAIASEEKGHQLYDLASRIEGLFRNSSIHPAGIVIGDRPLIEFVPLFKDPRGRDDFQSTQYDMVWVERAGLVKFDFLSSKAQTAIRATLDFIHETGDELDLSRIPLDDREALDLYCRAETAGLYQVEGEGMRNALLQLQPDRFEDLIAVVALYRPGPMQNIELYCAVKHGEKEMDLLHPGLEPILSETYGIIVYQEQVMEIARSLAGYSLGEADLLRRAMGKKKPEEMKAQKARFLEGLRQHGGLDKKQSETVYDLVLRFADYGFNKSHAAAYALVSYQTAYLKAHYPSEFFAATLNAEMGSNDAGRFEKIATLWAEARRRGIRVLPPDANRSHARFRPIDGVIPYALGAIKGVGTEASKRIAEAREKGGTFMGIGDLARRVNLADLKRQGVENLARSGAFDSIEPNRKRLALSAEDLVRYSQSFHNAPATGLASLFDEEELEVCEPVLADVEDFDVASRFEEERNAAGFLISGHPLDAHRSELGKRDICLASQVSPDDATGRRRAAGMITAVERQVSRSNKPYARITLSDSMGGITVLMFDRELGNCGSALQERELVVLDLEVVRRDGRDGMIICRNLKKLGQWEAERTPAAHSKRVEGLRIRLKSAEAAEGLGESLRRICATNGSGSRYHIRVALRLADLGAWAEVDLPGQFRLSPNAQRALETETGVLAVEPFVPPAREQGQP